MSTLSDEVLRPFHLELEATHLERIGNLCAFNGEDALCLQLLHERGELLVGYVLLKYRADRALKLLDGFGLCSPALPKA